MRSETILSEATQQSIAIPSVKEGTLVNRMKDSSLFTTSVIALIALQKELQGWIDEQREESKCSCELSMDIGSKCSRASLNFNISDYQDNNGDVWNIEKEKSIDFKSINGEMSFSTTGNDSDSKWFRTENPLMVIKAFSNTCNKIIDAMNADYEIEQLPTVIKLMSKKLS